MAASNTVSVHQRSSSDPDVYDTAILKTVFYVLTHFPWVVPVVFGIPGNIISVLVAARKHNRGLSTCVYMAAMGLADTGQLIQQAWFIPLFYAGLGDHFVVGVRDFLFKYEWFVTYNCGMLSGMFLAEMSVDRLIAVRLPMAVSRLCTPSKAKKTVIVTFVLITLVNLTTFLNHQYVKDEETGIEVLIVSVPGQPEIEVLTSTVQLVLGTVCPSAIILVSNTIIIITVKRASRERAKLKNTEDTSEKETSSGRHMTRMLIFVSAAYVITSLPYRLYHLIIDIPEVASFYDMKITYWNLRYNVQIWVVFNLWCWNFAINFYLYCVGGGMRYRKDTKEVISEIFCCVKKRLQI